MAYQEQQIPEKPSPRAPPPPRQFESPPPNRKKESINKSQIKIAIIMVILLIFFIIILYLSFILHSQSYNRTMDQDVGVFSFEFNVPDLLSEDIPVRIEIESSDGLEFYVLDDKEYIEDLTRDQLHNLSINKNTGKTDHFVYEDDFAPGKYVIVSYQPIDQDKDISLTYTLTRYFLMPFLWLISLIFILLFLVCIIRIFLLQRKKSTIKLQVYHEPDYRDEGRYYPSDRGSHEPPEPYDYDSGYSRADYGGQPSHHYQRPPPPQQPHYRQPMPPPTQPYHPPRGVPYRQRHGPLPHGSPQRRHPGPQPTTVPCKCGEIIVIRDPTRPLHIECPRCGRHGLLEGKKKSPDDEIFY